MRRAPRWRVPAIALAIAAGVAAIAIGWPAPRAAPIDPPRVERAGPVASRTVYWVGHSLMNARDDRVVEGAESLLERVGSLARARGLSYDHFGHTLWGSPLSLLWRGRPHGWDRDAPEMPARLAELRERGARYDAMVLTEVIPVRTAIETEHSAYYLGRFACELVARRPDAEIFLYHAWPHLQASDPEQGYGSPASYSFARRAREDRAFHDRLADDAARGGLEPPELEGRITRWVEPPTCRLPAIRIIPVGSVLAAIADRIESVRLPYRGRDLAMTDFFFNPYLDWPEGWPRDDLDETSARRELETLARRDPARPVDDIHPSDLGVYVSSLVHFAVLYRESPEGLPALADGLEPDTARWLQRIASEIVLADPRAGVDVP